MTEGLCTAKAIRRDIQSSEPDIDLCNVATRKKTTHRLSPVSWSMSVTGIFRSISSCGESFDCWRDNSSECAASRWRASFDRGFVAFDLIIDDVVVVCTSGTSKELVDDGLADPVDSSSFRASLFSFMFTPSEPSSARKRRKTHISFLRQISAERGRLMTVAVADVALSSFDSKFFSVQIKNV